jgi:hypothetical protein
MLGPRRSPFAHRRRAYAWTSQHTYVVSMQVRRTIADALYVLGGAGGVQIPASAAQPQCETTDRLHPCHVIALPDRRMPPSRWHQSLQGAAGGMRQGDW